MNRKAITTLIIVAILTLFISPKIILATEDFTATAPEIIDAYQCAETTYPIELQNTGNTITTLDLESAGQSGNTLTISAQHTTLKPEELQTISAKIKIPCSATLGIIDATILITSSGGMQKQLNQQILIKELNNLNFQINNTKKESYACENTTYKTTVTNNGPIRETYTFEITGKTIKEFIAKITPSTSILESGANNTITTTITPKTCDINGEHSFTLRAKTEQSKLIGEIDIELSISQEGLLLFKNIPKEITIRDNAEIPTAIPITLENSGENTTTAIITLEGITEAKIENTTITLQGKTSTNIKLLLMPNNNTPEGTKTIIIHALSSENNKQYSASIIVNVKRKTIITKIIAQLSIKTAIIAIVALILAGLLIWEFLKRSKQEETTGEEQKQKNEQKLQEKKEKLKQQEQEKKIREKTKQEEKLRKERENAKQEAREEIKANYNLTPKKEAIKHKHHFSWITLFAWTLIAIGIIGGVALAYVRREWLLNLLIRYNKEAIYGLIAIISITIIARLISWTKKPVETIIPLKTAQPKKINNYALGFTTGIGQLTILLNKQAENALLKIQKEKGSTFVNLQNEVYEKFKIETKNLDSQNLKKIEATIAIPEKWLAKNKAIAESVEVNIFTGKYWKTLKTEYSQSTNKTSYFTAELEGAGTYAITAKQGTSAEALKEQQQKKLQEKQAIKEKEFEEEQKRKAIQQKEELLLQKEKELKQKEQQLIKDKQQLQNEREKIKQQTKQEQEKQEKIFQEKEKELKQQEERIEKELEQLKKQESKEEQQYNKEQKITAKINSKIKKNALINTLNEKQKNPWKIDTVSILLILILATAIGIYATNQTKLLYATPTINNQITTSIFNENITNKTNGTIKESKENITLTTNTPNSTQLNNTKSIAPINATQINTTNTATVNTTNTTIAIIATTNNNINNNNINTVNNTDNKTVTFNGLIIRTAEKELLINLNKYFKDPDNDTLTYKTKSNNENITVIINNGTAKIQLKTPIQITPIQIKNSFTEQGMAEQGIINFTANDGKGGIAVSRNFLIIFEPVANNFEKRKIENINDSNAVQNNTRINQTSNNTQSVTIINSPNEKDKEQKQTPLQTVLQAYKKPIIQGVITGFAILVLLIFLVESYQAYKRTRKEQRKNK